MIGGVLAMLDRQLAAACGRASSTPLDGISALTLRPVPSRSTCWPGRFCASWRFSWSFSWCRAFSSRSPGRRWRRSPGRSWRSATWGCSGVSRSRCAGLTGRYQGIIAAGLPDRDGQRGRHRGLRAGPDRRPAQALAVAEPQKDDRGGGGRAGLQRGLRAHRRGDRPLPAQDPRRSTGSRPSVSGWSSARSPSSAT